MSNCLIRPAESGDAATMAQIETAAEAALGRPASDPHKRLVTWLMT